MIKFFRKIRQGLLAENKFTKYLVYALGEIVLVVIGILIALQINNLNEERKAENRLIEIYERVIVDMEKDIEILSFNKQRYESVRFAFEKVIADSITVELLDSGLSRLLSSGIVSTLNTTGVNQLRNESRGDSLSERIIEVYDYMQNVDIRPTEEQITKEVYEHADYLKENATWYAEWLSKTITSTNCSPELQQYFTSDPIYINRVHWNYRLIYNSYIPLLEWYTEELESLKADLKKHVNKP